jgi:hypothetical protein
MKYYFYCLKYLFSKTEVSKHQDGSIILRYPAGATTVLKYDGSFLMAPGNDDNENFKIMDRKYKDRWKKDLVLSILKRLFHRNGEDDVADYAGELDEDIEIISDEEFDELLKEFDEDWERYNKDKTVEHMLSYMEQFKGLRYPFLKAIKTFSTWIIIR